MTDALLEHRRGQCEDFGRTEASDINTSDLRDMEGFITQKTHLFHDSIRNN